MPVHDFYCRKCGSEKYDVQTRIGKSPRCDNCKRPMRVSWTHGIAPSTDVRGSATVSPVLLEPDSQEPLRYTSTRELERKMAQQKDSKGRPIGYVPSGDSVGGARNNDGFRGTVFSSGSPGGRSSKADQRVT